MEIFSTQLPNYPTAASFLEDMVLGVLAPDTAGERLLPQDFVDLMPEPYLSRLTSALEQVLARAVEVGRLDPVGGCRGAGTSWLAVGCWLAHARQ